jgi:hypothetical protein
MGYTTDFEGHFTLDKPLTPEQAAYLHAFCETRRMIRDVAVLEKAAPVAFKGRRYPGSDAEPLPEGATDRSLREAVGLPLGPEGAYHIGSGYSGQDHDASILDYNVPPKGQPGLWCQWVPTKDGKGIGWDGGEKFYNYIEWLVYLIEHFLQPWGYVLSGQVIWQGEDRSDVGKIKVVDNVVSSHEGRVVYSDEEDDDDE